jgi:hypothetical protein
MSMVQYLKRFLFILAVLVVSLHLGAQDPEYFIYLQSERSQPFYVRYEGKVLSSSDKGYLIISKVHAGTASLRIGFANGSSSEQQFLVKVSGNNDQGYLIKKNGDEGYALYNLQTFAAIRPSKGVPKESVTVTPAVIVKDTTVVEALTPAPVAGDSSMMTSLKKDLDSTFTNTSDVTVGPGSRPVNTIAPPVPVSAPAPVVTPPAAKPQGNMFSNALDKVVGDDRVEEVPPPADDIVVVDTAATTTTDAAPVAVKKPRKRRRDVLTPEEQKLAADVIAEEHLAEATADALAFDSTVAPIEKKSRRHEKKADDPAFINFADDSTKQASIPAPVPVVAPAEETSAPSKKKKHKTETEIPENGNNIVADSTGYAVSDLSIDHPKESKREKRKKKEAEDAGIIPAIVPTEIPVAAPVTEAGEEKKSAVKMINSDCGNVLDETNFRKVLRKFVAGKDDDGMIEAFRRQTKGYCLETSQIKTLVQLLGTNESRYHLLDLAYPKVSDSEHYSSLETVLTDDYYKGRFKAMLHK